MKKAGFHSKEREYRKRAAELVSKMTDEEKISQLIYKAKPIDRLGVPQYNWWNEALHGVARAGVATMFPQSIGLGSTFDEDLIYKVADIISTEARAKYNMQQKYGDRGIYKGLTFWSPNVNIFRDPRWGRGQETYGEDPYLTSRLGVAFVEGIQGKDKKYMKAAACAKHYAVHSGPETLRHGFNSVVSMQDMYETYFPAFKSCVQEAKVEAVMGAYNCVNGEPCCGSKTLLKHILREEWKFKGHVTSDCWAIRDFHQNHKVTSSPIESASMALNNGCDLNCGELYSMLGEALREGKISRKRLDDAVINLFTTRMKLGMFDNGQDNPYSKIEYSEVDTDKSRKFNLKVSQDSLVLLKNDGLLPLDISKVKTIGVIGPNANSIDALKGNYYGTASEYVTVLEGIRNRTKGKVKVVYSEGCSLHKDKVEPLAETDDRLAEAKAVCAESDVVVMCLGLDSNIEGEGGDQSNYCDGGDRITLDFPGRQNVLLKAAVESGKPVIVVSMTGSPVTINYAEDNCSAIIQAWYPGSQGGNAVAHLIFGDYSPSGKLPITFVKNLDDVPSFTDYSMKNRTYRYFGGTPLYPFGYGLSYTSFKLSEVNSDKNIIEKSGNITITGKLTNTGKVSGAETVQVYIESGIKGAPKYQLKGLKKLSLKPGESKEFSLTLTDDSFGVYDEEPKKIIRKGTYKVYVGTAQPDSRTTELTGHKPCVIKVECKKDETLYTPKSLWKKD
ncbi:MAG: glycoside hydrolase family 3 C-terminal domain-containing protein [Clostridiales bacterium]|nr:glycoside hydrolase family 3 C-terminal domain-containing protein [Clostridiales bacterium]